MNRTAIVLSVLAVFLSTLCFGAEGTDTVCGERPKVGVVLSGGGAKGSAHIGALKVLEEVGIPVDFVAGTSMGSVIGGMYCLGYTPEELDSLIGAIDWSVYMSNSAARKQLSFQDKERRSKYLLTIPFASAASLDSTMETGRTRRDEMTSRTQQSSNVFAGSIPAGFINGNNIESLIGSLCFGYQDSVDFNLLPIPFACVATDMVSGEEVVFHNGSLVKAIRSSMAIPGVFSPVRTGNMVLVDGGMLNNFPVDVCKAMGADIIIGVRVSSKVGGSPDDLNSLPKLIDQLMGVVTKSKAEDNIAMCDIFIEPDVTGYGPMSFDPYSIDTLIERGYKAADRQRDALVSLKKSLEAYGLVKQSYKAPKAVNIDHDTLTISTVDITGVSENEKAWLLRKSRILRKKRLTGVELEKAVSFFYGTNAFSKINYSIHPDAGDSTYHVRINLVKGVPHSFGFGFRFDSQEAAAILLGLGINEQKLTGVKFSLSTRLSYNPWVTARVSFASRVFPKFSLSYTFRKSETNLRYRGRAFANSMFLNQTAKACFSEYNSRFLSTEVGASVENYIYTQFFTGNDGTYAPGLSFLRSAYAGVYGTLRFDSKDRSVFPSKGVDFMLYGSWKFYDFYKNVPFSDFGEAQINFLSYIPLIGPRLVLSPQVYARFVMGDDYLLAYDNLVGGVMPGRYVSHQLPFIGANRPEMMYNSVAILRLDLRWNVYRKHYVTVMGNYAREANGIRNFMTPKTSYEDGSMTAYDLWGVGLRYSYDLPIGPVDVDFSWSNLSKSFGVYVNLGYYF
ncbi:MAG TPA: patatin-like phospholipase family protein [Candidatus Coprenecus stercoravium]|uniref:Patatin-like phospholipase family protein n=1 Tax=Candidatus Coprenecus stercoravium TaxID=2840735 RepID=A0A9D2GRU2_9BACT|nr:patatin-like phospholipase family protein [Candidatus Coprenecus stercoravium]